MTTVVDPDELPWQEGTVKWFSPEKGWGFLGVPGYSKDVFFHVNSAGKSGLTLQDFTEGNILRVCVKACPKGFKAHKLAPKEKP